MVLSHFFNLGASTESPRQRFFLLLGVIAAWLDYFLISPWGSYHRGTEQTVNNLQFINLKSETQLSAREDNEYYRELTPHAA